MNVSLVSVSPDAEKHMAYCARVSNPNNQDNENYADWNNNIMDRAKLKLMVRNLELLVDDIKAEVFSDVESYVSPPPTITQDYDEILEDDDGYPD